MNKTLVDLEIDNYRMYQDKDLFCFGMDAVLLANFALSESKILKSNNGAGLSRSFYFADFCSGNAPIPLIMYAKLKSKNIDAHFDCFEINEKAVALAKESLDYNADTSIEDGPKDINIKNYFNIYNMNIKDIIFDKKKFGGFRDHFDLLTCNPPYMKKGACLTSDSIDLTIARSEEKINFSELADAASFLLKSGKEFFIIHKSERLAEIIATLKIYHLEPKKIQFIHSTIFKNSNLFLMEAVKDAKDSMITLPPIIIDENAPIFIKK